MLEFKVGGLERAAAGKSSQVEGSRFWKLDGEKFAGSKLPNRRQKAVAWRSFQGRELGVAKYLAISRASSQRSVFISERV